MAAGDVTLINSETFGFGPRTLRICTVELPASYPAGGIALAALDGVAGAGKKFGFTTVDFVEIPLVKAANGALIGRYDRATDKIMLHGGNGPGAQGPFRETGEGTIGLTELRCVVVGRL